MGSVSVDSMVNKILYEYDHNKNGEIEYRKTSVKDTILGKNENVRYSGSAFGMDDTVSVSVTKYSRGNLFYAADGQGNNDGKVDRAELTKIVATYDTNNDGSLDKRGFWGRLFSGFKKPAGELNVFNKEYRERRATSSVTF